ncbi:MAG: phage tail sheath family protein [Rhodobacteraceae bacterium]|nr:phage tail sheath family protein [Paracoccaceae bacterium]
MPSYSTPGVYVEEIASLPASVAPVATAIPAFIGYVERTVQPDTTDLVNTPVRITSLLEFEALFGAAPVSAATVDIEKTVETGGRLVSLDVRWATSGAPADPSFLLYYSVRMYYANGGGPCYIYPVGIYGPPSTPTTVAQADFTAAITALEAEDEPTLLVFPDATNLSNSQHGAVVTAALNSCVTTQDRFTIADVRNAVVGGTVTNQNVTDNFRSQVTAAATDVLKYGAAYFPYLRTTMPFRLADTDVTIASFVEHAIDPANPSAAPTDTDILATLANGDLADLAPGAATADTAVYSEARQLVDSARVIMPPSGAVAGIYARVDRTRGVWKAPANVGIALSSGPAVPITDDLNGSLNVDPGSGKSVNVLRSFAGKGTLVWGARTLAGNDSEWKYVPVRRFANFVEESVKKAIGVYVFEPNDANTWVKVRTMIENFLSVQWRDGALQGAKPEQAFQVDVGLGKTMTAADILNGLMIVEVRLAIVRPAEFIVLRFIQKLPEA